MLKIENFEVTGWEAAIRGMRNPKNSWKKSDSFIPCYHKTECHKCEDNQKCAYYFEDGLPYKKDDFIGANDLDLMTRLRNAGTDHRKFMRMIIVYLDITAPLYYWKEFDTYKVGTVRNSCSTMHKIHVKEFVYDDFTHEGIDECNLVTTFKNYLTTLEYLRTKFNETKEKKYWRALIEMLPDGFNMKATITLDYENLLGMCSKNQRRFHKLNEWSGIDYNVDNFISWARTLPYSQELIFIDELQN